MANPWLAIALTSGFGFVVVMLIAWLSSRRATVVRAIGALLSGIVTIYCLIYVVALIAESRAGFKSIGAALVVVFAVTAVGAVYATFRGFYPRIRPRPNRST